MSLVVKNLSKKYGEKTVVDNLNFEMQNPGVFALLGTNGAGKTTSIRMMLNMLSKDSGEVLWNGAPLDTRTCNVGYLAEERGLYPKYALMDQLLYFASLRGIPKADAKKRIRYWAERLEVEEYLYPNSIGQGDKSQSNVRRGDKGQEDMSRSNVRHDSTEQGDISQNNVRHDSTEQGDRSQSNMRRGGARRKQASKKADQLSKGNQQKIQFMAALISDPELLILDEPLSGLDPVNTDLFKEIIREEIAGGKYLIMSSHQMATVEEFCTDIIIMNRSKTILQGHLNDIKKSYGRINLSLKTETDVKPLIDAAGIRLLTQKENEYRLKVSGEGQANAFLKSLIENHVSVITFDLREPSLHEIFVEKVGDANED